MMNEFSIYCTPKQTKKAFALGAPIFPIKSRRTKETVISSDDVISYDEDFFTYVTNPTSEQMFGWLRKQGFRFSIDEYGYTTLWRVMYDTWENHGKCTKSTEANLAAIDTALDYLLSIMLPTVM